MKVKWVLFIIICLLGYQMTTAQTDFVVTTKNDTLKGKVKYLNFGIEKKVQVTTDDGKKVYSILQTLAFCMKNELYFPIRTAQGYTYMKVLKSGYLSLYAFQLSEQNWDGRYLLKKDGAGQEVPNLGFKKAMTRLLGDCPEVASRIQSGELKESRINKIIDAYNTCIDDNTRNQKPVPSTGDSGKMIAWEMLEKNVNSLDAFEGKSNVLEMIQDVKSKINKGEKIPTFLTEGLKEALKDQPTVQETLEKALQGVKN